MSSIKTIALSMSLLTWFLLKTLGVIDQRMNKHKNTCNNEAPTKELLIILLRFIFLKILIVNIIIAEIMNIKTNGRTYNSNISSSQKYFFNRMKNAITIMN